MTNIIINKELASLDIYTKNGSKLLVAFTNVKDAQNALHRFRIRGRQAQAMIDKFQKFLENNSQVTQKYSGSLIDNKGKRVVNPVTGEVFIIGSRRGRLPSWVKTQIT